MNKSLIAILASVAISITGCTKAGESTVSDYEQGGCYFQEEQQIQQKEVESKANNDTTQPTKISDKQQTESKHNSNRTNTQHQYKKSTKGADRVKHNSESSEEPKHNNQSTQENTQQDDPFTKQIKESDTLCSICGCTIHYGDDWIARDNGFIAHKYCYQHELDDNAKHDI